MARPSPLMVVVLSCALTELASVCLYGKYQATHFQVEINFHVHKVAAFFLEQMSATKKKSYESICSGGGGMLSKSGNRVFLSLSRSSQRSPSPKAHNTCPKCNRPLTGRRKRTDKRTTPLLILPLAVAILNTYSCLWANFLLPLIGNI